MYDAGIQSHIGSIMRKYLHMSNRILCLATQTLNLRALIAMLRAFSDVMS